MSSHRIPTPPPVVPLDSEDAQHAVEVAPRIWWVGAVLVDDPFQCHAYLIEAGERSVLVDAGSALTIEETIRKVREVVPLDHVATLLVHHSDPDCADGLHQLGDVLDHDRTTIVTEWRSQLLLKHMKPAFGFTNIEDLGWRLDLDAGRSLEFAMTPYLHFPGAFVTYDRSTATILTSDLFGGFNHANRLIATDPVDLEDLTAFHQHYMPSREILMAGVARLRERFPMIDTILPQHGYVLPSHLVDAAFDSLLRLDCGVLMMSREDAHLARLIEAAGAVRRIEAHLDESAPLPELLEQIAAELRSVITVDDVALERRDGTRAVRFDRSHPAGIEVADAEPGPGRLLWTLGDDGHGRALTAVIDHDALDPPVEHDVLSILDAATEHGRQAMRARLDVLDATNAAERWQRSATRDALTGLLNRHVLADLAVGTGTALLMIDLDHFKRVNDTWGHDVGDEVLRRAADCVQRLVREPDLAIRYGGEELMVIAAMPTAASIADQEACAAALGERIRSGIEALLFDGAGTDTRGTLTVTASVGVAVTERDETFERAVRRADAALYRAKSDGRNQVAVSHAAVSAN